MGFVVVVAVLMFLLVRYQQLFRNIMAERDEERRNEWRAETEGFPGNGERRVCVVSMSGLDQEFWFGIKDICKDMRIGFACVWMADLGDTWWDHWKQNVHDFGISPGNTELVVLVDPALAEKGATPDRRE